MESSQFIGDEECCSSESGWTMYLAPNMHDDGGDGDGDDDGKKQGNGKEGDGDDDSMASDASTGPAHHGEKGDVIDDIDHPNHDDYEDDEEIEDNSSQNSCYSNKKVGNKKGEKRPSVGKKEDGATSLIHSSSKVRKAE